ncbi:MAG: glycosyltransferase family 2 protein [Candidatus Lindowbacteria bacterium]|nr:glycosyltransferase family 2 protein [Candidatus Lindowbacteria bacterium]
MASILSQLLSRSAKQDVVKPGLRIVVVIPSRNEEKQIAETLTEIKGAFEKGQLGEPILLLTDDSTDRTREIARSHGAHIVNGGGKGLGVAMYVGLKESLKFNPDVIVAYDADGQVDPDEIPIFVAEIENDAADMILASRFCKEGLVQYDYPALNRFGTIVLSEILKGFTGLPLTDSHGGIRAMKPGVVRELEMLGTHTYVQETIIDAAEKGFRIKELPSVWRKRTAGKSRVVGSIPTYVFYTLPILILRSKQHLKWLYTSGILLVATSMLYFSFIFYQESFSIVGLIDRIPALLAVVLLSTTGIQLFFFGFILQLLKNIKYQVDKAAQDSHAVRVRGEN